VSWFGAALFCAIAGLAAGAPQNEAVARQLGTYIADGALAGAMVIVADRDKVISEDIAGWADLQAKVPLRSDHLFWIASMTKPMTAVAVMMLQDEGKLRIDDPVAKHLPEFAGQGMLAASPGGPPSPVRPITLRDLLTHTAGLSEVPAARPDLSLAELVATYAQAPLRHPPGSRWEYSNAGINTLGRIVEVAAGERFERFLQRRLLDPLGMVDTTFWPSPAQAARLAKVYRRNEDDPGLAEVPNMIITTSVTDASRTPLPAGGLYSTAADLLAFYRFMLNGGQAGGRRLLSPEAHQLLTHTQSGDLPTGFTPGMSWGLGFQVVKAPQGATAMFSPGTYGHGGAYATQSWADPVQGRILIFLVQQAGLGNSDAWPIRAVLQNAAVLRDQKSPVSELR